ncbi:hypothetical protein GOBAR_AA07968 [Gossypium barbadense]|uniref:Uncharacterized protein n=1 Tax=Gossypium barbadense TaxID=3634 RepID=A0A2P5YAN3_GOSBA|nr:hypothetical protein GOBAR_AA07968 [Gossypium barbadense]
METELGRERGFLERVARLKAVWRPLPSVGAPRAYKYPVSSRPGSEQTSVLEMAGGEVVDAREGQRGRMRTARQ